MKYRARTGFAYTPAQGFLGVETASGVVQAYQPYCPHVYRTTPTSEARKRIDAAGEEFQRERRAERMKREAEEKREADERRAAAEREEKKIRDWLDLGAYEPIDDTDTPILTMAQIAKEVAKKTGISVLEMKAARRTKDVVAARHVAMWRCYYETKHSLPEIGRFFGDRDHTTILHAVRKIEAEQGKAAKD